MTRTRCWRKDWVLEFDIKGLFDNIRHDYLMEMVKFHTKEEWILLYIQRWLVAPFQMEDGTVVPRTSGTPQGGVISPVLANLFLHYVFDDFMVKEFPSIPWARYADDGIAHCVSLKQAKYLKRRLQEQFAAYGLELNLEKTRIVYCKDDDRKGNHEHTSFDFLGYTFRPRLAKNKYGKFFVSFLPAMGEKAKKAIRKEVRSWKLQFKTDKGLWDIANMFNNKIQGWINYYTHFYKSEIRVATETEDEQWDLIPMVMVDGKLYLDTGVESSVEARCGVMDGEITSSVDGTKNKLRMENLILVQVTDISMVHRKEPLKYL